MTKTKGSEIVKLEYQLHQLPSSQHRAGLAGLILKIQWLQQQATFKESVDAVCEIIHLDTNKATLQFNLAGLTALFRSHYSASFEEREQLKLRKTGSQNFRIIQREIYDEKTDCSKLTDIYVYQDIVPQGHLIQSFDPTANGSQIWTKLWQEATWGILRPNDRQRIPFGSPAYVVISSAYLNNWSVRVACRRHSGNYLNKQANNFSFIKSKFLNP